MTQQHHNLFLLFYEPDQVEILFWHLDADGAPALTCGQSAGKPGGVAEP